MPQPPFQAGQYVIAGRRPRQLVQMYLMVSLLVTFTSEIRRASPPPPQYIKRWHACNWGSFSTLIYIWQATLDEGEIGFGWGIKRDADSLSQFCAIQMGVTYPNYVHPGSLALWRGNKIAVLSWQPLNHPFKTQADKQEYPSYELVLVICPRKLKTSLKRLVSVLNWCI